MLGNNCIGRVTISNTSVRPYTFNRDNTADISIGASRATSLSDLRELLRGISESISRAASRVITMTGVRELLRGISENISRAANRVISLTDIREIIRPISENIFIPPIITQ